MPLAEIAILDHYVFVEVVKPLFGRLENIHFLSPIEVVALRMWANFSTI